MRASHLAVLWGEGGAAADLAHLEALCRRHDVPPPLAGTTHFTAAFGAFALKWERHTEFSTYIFLLQGAAGGGGSAFDDAAITRVPQDWLAAMPGSVLVAAHFVLQSAESPMPDADALARVLVADTTAGSGISAETLAILRIAPPPAASMWAPNTWQPQCVARRLIENIRSHSSSVTLR